MDSNAAVQPGVDAGHQVDVTDAVLEADQIGAGVGEFPYGVVAERGVGAVIHDHAEAGRLAHRADMGDQPRLGQLGQIRRQQEDTRRARGLGVPCHRDRLRRAVTGRGHDGLGVTGRRDGRAYDVGHLGGREREELAGPSRREDTGRRQRGLPREVFAVGVLVEAEIGTGVGDGEGEQSRAENGT